MTGKNAPLIALIVSLIVLSQLIGGISCLVKESESDSPIATARETVYAQMTRLEEQKFEGPNPLTPINVGDVEAEITQIGADYRAAGTGVGAGINVGGGGGGGVGIGISIGGG
jgi:hypothetical protein